MTTVKRICACRVPIEAEPDPVSIEHAVRTHQAEPEHRYWQMRQQLLSELVPPEPVVLGVRATLRRVG